MVRAIYTSFKDYDVTTVKGFSLGADNIIAINSDLSKEEQKETLHHEMLHFLLGHLDGSRDISVDEAEKEIHNIMADTHCLND